MDRGLGTRPDGMLRITLLEGQARALMAETTGLCDRAREIHSLSRTATAALGRLLTGSVMMGWMLKGPKDSVTVSVRGNGPLGAMLAVGRPDGAVKGYVGHPGVELPLKNGKLDVGGGVGADGELAVIKDMGLREPYMGRVKLVSGELAEDLAMYFVQSEQTPSLVSLGVLTAERVVSAGGLIVQPLPGCSEAALRSLELSAPMFGDISATMLAWGLDGAVGQLLGHLQPVVTDRAAPAYQCDCSRDRMERALISLGELELKSMIKEGRDVTLNCHFCGASHSFTPVQLAETMTRARPDAPNRREA
ncbi:MAG: Hsp33 family molecular chaperone HslO [Clostridiales bacterium]|nr:Hsp33 family molecular chaperone HslO [Clostridiales bacterium]